ncbi:MAG: PF20097 family protein [Clostridiales bacterium]|nr:PF20097 family protein [Clostridiales bacterium]MCD7830176.1 PF20097 family protein [Clostridiales bacterium]MCD7887372.1 PF20097 family protein [Clostridiales bacterium]MCD8333972.1 PF20097 family protein [Clostridiales bacterium]
MICPICGGQMEQGRIEVMLFGSDASSIINWYPEAEFQKTGVGRIFKKNGKTVRDACTRQTEAWYCARCQKVCAIMDVKG